MACLFCALTKAAQVCRFCLISRASGEEADLEPTFQTSPSLPDSWTCRNDSRRAVAFAGLQEN